MKVTEEGHDHIAIWLGTPLKRSLVLRVLLVNPLIRELSLIKIVYFIGHQCRQSTRSTHSFAYDVSRLMWSQFLFDQSGCRQTGGVPPRDIIPLERSDPQRSQSFTCILIKHILYLEHIMQLQPFYKVNSVLSWFYRKVCLFVFKNTFTQKIFITMDNTRLCPKCMFLWKKWGWGGTV